MNKELVKFEWEYLLFPLKISSITSKLGRYKIPFDASFELWRDEDYRLKGIIAGTIHNPKDLDYQEMGIVNKAGFMTGDEITASDDENNYLIKGLIIDFVSFKSSPNNLSGFTTEFSSKVFFSSIEKVNVGEQKVTIFSEWYLCSLPQLFFLNRTLRYPNEKIYKMREGIDEVTEDVFAVPPKIHSSSRDFAILDYKGNKIILQQVDAEYLPKWTNGISIEYRCDSVKLPEGDERKMIREYVSFILGSHLQLISETMYGKHYQVLNFSSQNPWKRNVRRIFCYHPIPVTDGLDLSYFERELNILFKTFSKNHEQLSLSDCLWKLWIGSEQPIGCNLPILASGLDVLIDSYLTHHNLIKKYNKAEKENYQVLIANEYKSLEKKLQSYEFGQFVLNKLSNPYNLGIGEKMKLFFNEIGLVFDRNSTENSALQARNKMTHQGLDSAEIEDLLKIKKLSDAYVTLINRVILKILGYEGYYVDYSKSGLNFRSMEQNM